MNSLMKWAAIAAVALLLSACGGGNSSPAPSAPVFVPVTTVANTAPAPVTAAPVAPSSPAPAPAPVAPPVAIVPRKPGASNAPPGYPTHSDDGYPLIYGIGGDGKPVGDPRLLHRGQTFASVAEIVDYEIRVANPGAPTQDPPYKGPLNPDLLDQLDWAWHFQNADKLPGDHDLFDRKPWIGNRATGYLLHSGDLSSADLSGYYAAGSIFAPYIKA